MQVKINTLQNDCTSCSSQVLSISQQKYPVEFLENVESQIIALCNIERAKIGVAPLHSNNKLKQIARYKSNEMLQYDYFSHKSPVSEYMPWNLAKAFGYSFISFGENIWMVKILSENLKSAYKFNATLTACSIMNDWMNSLGHKTNILNSAFGKIGVGLAYSPKLRAYATQLFSD